MVVIRLSRGGTNKRPFYKVVVADSRRARDCRYLEHVGFFNPIASGADKRLELKMDRVEYWLSKGAQPSERVASLIKDFKNPELVVKRQEKRAVLKARKIERAAAEAPVEGAAAV